MRAQEFGFRRIGLNFSRSYRPNNRRHIFNIKGHKDFLKYFLLFLCSFCDNKNLIWSDKIDSSEMGQLLNMFLHVKIAKNGIGNSHLLAISKFESGVALQYFFTRINLQFSTARLPRVKSTSNVLLNPSYTCYIEAHFSSISRPVGVMISYAEVWYTLWHFLKLFFTLMMRIYIIGSSIYSTLNTKLGIYATRVNVGARLKMDACYFGKPNPKTL